MAKKKSRRSLVRRIKVTKTGKLIRRTQNMRHLRYNKTKAQIRRMKSVKFIIGPARKKLLKMLGI